MSTLHNAYGDIDKQAVAYVEFHATCYNVNLSLPLKEAYCKNVRAMVSSG